MGRGAGSQRATQALGTRKAQDGGQTRVQPIKGRGGSVVEGQGGRGVGGVRTSLVQVWCCVGEREVSVTRILGLEPVSKGSRVA